MLLQCSVVLMTLLALGSADPLPGHLGGHGHGHGHEEVPVVPVGGVHHGIHCEKFCKNEYTNEYECCDHIRPGKCPDLRPHCPPVRDYAAPPNPCYTDDDCYGEHDKCCPDVCLGHNTCKPIKTTY